MRPDGYAHILMDFASMAPQLAARAQFSHFSRNYFNFMSDTARYMARNSLSLSLSLLHSDANLNFFIRILSAPFLAFRAAVGFVRVGADNFPARLGFLPAVLAYGKAAAGFTGAGAAPLGCSLAPPLGARAARCSPKNCSTNFGKKLRKFFLITRLNQSQKEK